MADGKFEDFGNNNPPPIDASAALHRDAQPEMPKPTEKVAAVAQALDVTKEGEAVQKRFEGGPDQGMAQVHENVAKHVASLSTTDEGKALLKNFMAENQAFYGARNPQVMENLGQHFKH